MTQLGFTDKHAWFGLVEKPTYDQMLRAVRKEARIPIPDRAAKWYATGIYRDFLTDAADKYHDHEQANLQWRRDGAHMPEAARNTDSVAGNDEAWQKPEQFTKALSHEEAYSLAQQAMTNEGRQRANDIRRQQLSKYGPTLVHPTLEAHHKDLEDQSIPHPAPIPRPSMHALA